MSAPRTLLLALRNRRFQVRRDAASDAAAVSWGRIGAYEGVSREGILHLLAPEPAQSGMGVKPGV